MLNFKPVFALALLGVVAFAPGSHAQTAAAPVVVATSPTIGLVDIQRVVTESSAGKSMITQLDGERRKLRDQATKLQDEINTSENEVKRQRSILQQEALNELVQGLQRKAADAQRIMQERQEAVAKAQNDAGTVILDNMRDVVQQFAAERHIGLVLRKEVVITVSDKNMDITDDVIQRLNVKLPSVTVTVENPSQAASAPKAAAPAAAAKPAAAPAKK
jgi:Skp family chaperone for outer membrane proteins